MPSGDYVVRALDAHETRLPLICGEYAGRQDPPPGVVTAECVAIGAGARQRGRRRVRAQTSQLEVDSVEDRVGSVRRRRYSPQPGSLTWDRDPIARLQLCPGSRRLPPALRVPSMRHHFTMTCLSASVRPVLDPQILHLGARTG